MSWLLKDTLLKEERQVRIVNLLIPNKAIEKTRSSMTICNALVIRVKVMVEIEKNVSH